MASTGDVTVLLRQWGDGDRGALDRLVPLVYDQLRELAHRRLLGEHGPVTLNTTALVHEAYLRLVDIRTARFHDRAHFLAMAARAMRRLLVDHARARRTARRGSGTTPLSLSEVDAGAAALQLDDARADTITEVDSALERLALVDERQSRILEQRYFGGLSLEETAVAVDVSLATVKRELRFARAWLAAEIGADNAL
jgi:RNA polymerase sigma factor (TIGR02999 family)